MKFVIVAALVLSMLRRALVEVRGRSMEPGLTSGDRLLTVPALPRLVTEGRIVVVRDPEDRTHLAVKRVHRVGVDGVDVRGDAPRTSTDSRHWGPIRHRDVRRVVVSRWPDVRSPLPRAR